MQKALSAAAAEAVTRPLLKGKSAVVTGSTSGIGLGIARAFASAGMNVMLMARRHCRDRKERGLPSRKNDPAQ